MRNRIDQPVSHGAGDIAAALTGIGNLLTVLSVRDPGSPSDGVLAAPLVLPVAALAIAAPLVVGPFRAIRRIARRVARHSVRSSVTFVRRSGSIRVRPANAGDVTESSRLFAVVAGSSVDREAEAELRAAAQAKGGQVVRANIGDSDPTQHFIDHVLPQLDGANVPNRR